MTTTLGPSLNLRSTSPRSFAIVSTKNEASNPFEEDTNTSNSYHLVIGTESGSLHSRSYTDINSSRYVDPDQSFNSQVCDGSIAGIIEASRVYLLLIDDNRGASKNGGAYSATFMTAKNGGFGKLTEEERRGRFGDDTVTSGSVNLPRMSCASYHEKSGYVYASGAGVYGLNFTHVKTVLNTMAKNRSGGFDKYPKSRQSTIASLHVEAPSALFLKAANALPRPGARCSPTRDSMTMACSGRVAIVAVSNSFYAVPACLDVGANGDSTALSVNGVPQSMLASVPDTVASKIVAFAQSSQVHPVIAIELAFPQTQISVKDMNQFLKPITSLVFLASGRECTAVEIVSTPDPRSVSLMGKGGRIVNTNVKTSPPFHGICNFASPILAAASLPSIKTGSDSLTSGPLLALLAVDGMVHIRSPFCLSVALSSIEVGTRPNDFFSVVSLSSPPSSNSKERKIITTSYGGESQIIRCREENSQEFADRLLKLSIDAFGVNGFPRLELAEALGATFSAASYVGQDATATKRGLLLQYLEAVLGLADDVRFFMGSQNVAVVIDGGQDAGLEVMEESFDVQDRISLSLSTLDNNALLTCTALLCLVCFQLDSPNATNATLANRAAKACSGAMGTVKPKDGSISKSAMAVCDLVADRLLKEAAAASFSLLSPSSSMSSTHRPSQNSASMEFVEAALWLLRSCGNHEKALQVLDERMNNPTLRNASIEISGGGSSSFAGWSQIKYDSYFATHLGDLWSSKDEACCHLVLRSSATRDLLARNPMLGLSIFTTLHPQNEKEWRHMKPSEDPLDHPTYPYKVVELLKSIVPKADKRSIIESPSSFGSSCPDTLPLHSGRALAVSYLESAIGVATGRPALTEDTPFDRSGGDNKECVANMHDELSYLLLEGVISERGDKSEEDSPLGAIYRSKLRRLLSWENTQIRSERLLASLPSSFLREHALLLGRLGRHEDAIKIFYSDLGSVELALEYCDIRYERQQALLEEAKHGGDAGVEATSYECSYLPLVKVALNSDPDSDRGLAAAIQVLSLRRNSIDKSAALQILPNSVSMAAIAKPFLIPALVESQSQVRRLTILEALLRSKHAKLKQKLTEVTLQTHSSLFSVPALQKLKLGDPLHSSKPIKARPVHLTSSHFPDVMLVKYFFHRHLVVQAQVTNTASDQTLSDLAFVIAESSDEAILPMMEVALKTLPPNTPGSAWAVCTASPQRMETCFLTCELRYTVLSGDDATGARLNAPGVGRTYVEELQDLEIRHNEFTPMNSAEEAAMMALPRLRPLAILALPLLVRSEINSFTLSSCSAGSIFDPAGLVCVDCDNEAGLQPMAVAGFNDNSMKCSCSRLYLQSSVECTIDSLREGTCSETSCISECSSHSEQVSFDQRQCVPCNAVADTSLPIFDAELKQCSCNNPLSGPPTGSSIFTRRLVEIYDDESGLPIRYDCQRCKEGAAVISASLYEEGKDYFLTAGARYTADPAICQSCPDNNMFFDTDYHCKCREGYLIGEASIGHQSCIERYPTVSKNFARAIFKSPTGIDFSLDSITYSHFYLRSASLCEFFKSLSGGLQSCQALGNLCVMNMYDRDSAACEQYLTISEQRSSTYHKQEDWKETLPWLYYSNEAEAVSNDRGIKMKMAFDANQNASNEISFRLAKYKLDGSFVGIEDLTNQFQYCSSSNENGEKIWSIFGNNYRSESNCNINRLLDKEMYFYDMYLVDKGLEACQGDSINVDCLYPVPVLNLNFVENDAFPNMNLSALDESDDKYTRRFFLFDNQSGRTSSGLEIIRFAKSIVLSIQVRSSDPTKLAPPTLIIEYSTKAVDVASIDSAKMLFKVDYSMTTENFWESLQILIGFVAAFAVVVYGVKMNNWQSRQQQNPPKNQDESLTSMNFVMQAFVVLCHVFVLLFFPFVVAVCLYWYTFFKLQDSVFLLLPVDNEFYTDTGNEYYFLWLSFHGLFVCQTVYILFTITRQCCSKIIFIDWERAKGRVNTEISTWRRVLVANEYLSLHTSRKHSIAFNLVLVGFLATFDDADSGRVNIALRFARTCLFWGIASCIQWIWRFVFYDRFYSEPRGQRFIDLSSVTNISVLILTEKYKSFYIHGRSPYHHSDCSMDELLESFRKEANGLTISRGLDAAPQGDQAFVLYCSGAFRNQIDGTYNLMRDTDSTTNVGTTALSNFLKGFIDQQPPPTQEGLKYAVREPSVSESVLGFTPADFRQSDPKCIMQPDRTSWNKDYQFLSSTFQGIELDLLLHDILAYNAIDLMFHNTAASIFVTYMIHLARKFMTSYFAKKNLSITSKIDERFLL